MSEVKGVIDRDWLSSELQKIKSYAPPKDKTRLTFVDYTDRYHPLAVLIHQVDKQLEVSGANENVTEEMMRLAHLGESLSILRQNSVKRLDCKIRNLTVSSELFEKTVYELQVASAYARANYKVAFLKEKPDEKIKTAEMEIDEQVEVECKQKDKLSQRDRRNHGYWKLIMQKASAIMNHLKCNYGFVVKTQRDPTQENVEFILHELRRFMKSKQQGRFAFPEKGIEITVKILSQYDLPITSHSMEFASTEELDFFVFAMEKKEDQPVIRNPRIFGFKCAIMPDRIKSVIESITKAKKQLSGNKPGMIYVDLNSIDRQMMDEDFRRLDTMVKRVLSKNSTISAVVITSQMFSRDTQGLVFKHKAKVIRNDVARYPVTFKIVGEP